MTKIQIKPQGKIGKVADALMKPLMYLLQGTFAEEPQRTHRWNNYYLRNLAVDHLEADKIEIVPGDTDARKRWLGPIPLFHVPLLGGWRKFVVLQPCDYVGIWYIGWVAYDAQGISKIQLSGPVRLGIGPRQAQFFGLDEDGKQIDIEVIGYGEIGRAGKYARVPLL